MDDSAFRYFGVGIVYKPCPSCGCRTAVGFDRNDPGVHDREATECTWCMAAKISNEVQFSRADPIPLDGTRRMRELPWSSARVRAQGKAAVRRMPDRHSPERT